MLQYNRWLCPHVSFWTAAPLQSSHSLCSPSETSKLQLQHFNHKTNCFHTFSDFNPYIWNNLPQDFRHSAAVSSFKNKLSSPNILIKQHCPSPLYNVCLYVSYSDIVSYVWTLVDVLKWTSEPPHNVVAMTLMHLYQAFMGLCVLFCFLLLLGFCLFHCCCFVVLGKVGWGAGDSLECKCADLNTAFDFAILHTQIYFKKLTTKTSAD